MRNTSAMTLTRRGLLQAGSLTVAGILAGVAGAQGSAQAATEAVRSRTKIPSLPALRSRLNEIGRAHV